MQSLKLVIVGHVDHGKSTLIGRLLFDTNSLPPAKMEEIKKARMGKGTEFAYLLDHFQEERDQGITIDTTQIFFKTPQREYVIIDAPGHVEFVKNMITGASQAEAAILMIDVEEGVKEQTRRHANILSLLGLSQVMVVINKMDLVNFQEEIFDKIKEEAKQFLNSINIKLSHFIPISATKGDNIINKSEKMSWYEGPTIIEGLDLFEGEIPSEEKSLLLPIQDIYKINGERINVGRVESGRLKKGQEIKVLPEGQITKVKSIKKFKEDLEEAKNGENIGIVTEDPIFIERGNVISGIDEEPVLTREFEAKLFWMNKKEFKVGEPLKLKCATQEVSVEEIIIKKRINSSSLEVLEERAESLGNLEIGEVIIKIKKPVVITKFSETQELGRFVLMRKEDVSAGGIIV